MGCHNWLINKWQSTNIKKIILVTHYNLLSLIILYFNNWNIILSMITGCSVLQV